MTTVTSTAAPSTTAAISSNSETCRDSQSTSSKPTATGVGVGVGAPLGLALLGAFGLIWRQRSRELGARKEAYNWEQKMHAWEEKYNELKKEKREDSTSVEGEIYELGDEGWTGRAEIDGRLVR